MVFFAAFVKELFSPYLSNYFKRFVFKKFFSFKLISLSHSLSFHPLLSSSSYSSDLSVIFSFFINFSLLSHSCSLALIFRFDERIIIIDQPEYKRIILLIDQQVFNISVNMHIKIMLSK